MEIQIVIYANGTTLFVYLFMMSRAREYVADGNRNEPFFFQAPFLTAECFFSAVLKFGTPNLSIWVSFSFVYF